MGSCPWPRHLPPRRENSSELRSILLLIVVWAAFVASLAPFVGKWPVLVQAPFYLIMGMAWIIPLKPLIRWSQTGSLPSILAASSLKLTVLARLYHLTE